MTTTAATIINAVRDMIPDPVYDGSGNALPDTDGGLVRASTLYRYLSDGLRATAIKTGYAINDWTGFALTAHQPHYDLDEKWQTIDDVFYKGWRTGEADEGYLMWPTTVESSQAVVWGRHRQTTNWQLRAFPAPSASDPTSTLTAGISASATSLTLASTSALMAYGMLLIDNELLWYYNNNTTTNTLSALIRGIGGTTAASHANAATVTGLSLWVKGSRLPAAVTASTDILELPLSMQYPLQLYVLSRVRQSENEYQESARLTASFEQECSSRLLDPRTKKNQGMQVGPYGIPSWGPLAWGRVVVP